MSTFGQRDAGSLTLAQPSLQYLFSLWMRAGVSQLSACARFFRLLLGFIIVTGFLSMWLSNTATTAMMIPIAHAVLVEMWKQKQSNSNHFLINCKLAHQLDASYRFVIFKISRCHDLEFHCKTFMSVKSFFLCHSTIVCSES